MRKGRITLTEYENVRKSIYALDYMGLTGFPLFCPDDEYDGEIAEICRQLDEEVMPSEEKAAAIIKRVMSESFGTAEDFGDDKSILICARQILGTTNEHICPVCRKYYFSTKGSYEICEECGWEDDPVQDEIHNYEGGANQLSVNEARLEYVMMSSGEFGAKAAEIRAEHIENLKNNIPVTPTEDREKLISGEIEKYIDSLAEMYSAGDKILARQLKNEIFSRVR